MADTPTKGTSTTDLTDLATEIGTVIVSLMSDMKPGETKSMHLTAGGTQWMITVAMEQKTRHISCAWCEGGVTRKINLL